MRTRIDKEDSLTVRVTNLQKVGPKPIGFWYSVDGGWERWCASEEPGWLENCFTHEVTLGSEKLIFLRTVEDIDRFHLNYSKKLSPAWRGFGIDWARVATEYDGIEISPYQWERRHDLKCEWYYPWDCASGCIWRPKGVTLAILRGAAKASH